ERADRHVVDARLELVDRLLAVDLRARRRDVVVRREHEVVDPAAEIRPVQPLAGRRPEDDEDRLADVLLVRRARDAAVQVHPDREPEALAEKVTIVRHGPPPPSTYTNRPWMNLPHLLHEIRVELSTSSMVSGRWLQYGHPTSFGRPAITMSSTSCH